ncbi:MAG: MazG-like family protein [Candidatus Magasanikiibacteriota bacterium]
MDLKDYQKQIFQNKLDKGFNITDIYREFCSLHEELTEACIAYQKRSNDVGEELADVAIYLLSLAEILQIDLESEIVKKVAKNKNRQYTKEADRWIKIGDNVN